MSKLLYGQGEEHWLHTSNAACCCKGMPTTRYAAGVPLWTKASSRVACTAHGNVMSGHLQTTSCQTTQRVILTPPWRLYPSGTYNHSLCIPGFLWVWLGACFFRWGYREGIGRMGGWLAGWLFTGWGEVEACKYKKNVTHLPPSPSLPSRMQKGRATHTEMLQVAVGGMRRSTLSMINHDMPSSPSPSDICAKAILHSTKPRAGHLSERDSVICTTVEVDIKLNICSNRKGKGSFPGPVSLSSSAPQCSPVLPSQSVPQWHTVWVSVEDLMWVHSHWQCTAPPPLMWPHPQHWRTAGSRPV